MLLLTHTPVRGGIFTRQYLKNFVLLFGSLVSSVTVRAFTIYLIRGPMYNGGTVNDQPVKPRDTPQTLVLRW